MATLSAGMTDTFNDVREALAAMTPGVWEFERGFADWGLPKIETLKVGDFVVAELPSVQPYCLGASRKDKELSQGQQANAAGIVTLRNRTGDVLAALDEARAEVARLRLDVRTQEALQESAYRAGMKFGWNCCDAGADEKYREVMQNIEHIAELKRIRAARAALEAGRD